MAISIQADELDLWILKTILTNKKYALEFAQEYNEKLFMPDLWRFTKILLDYVKAYKEIITPRVFREQTKANKTLIEYIEVILTKLDNIKYNDQEYKFDLEKLKKRYKEKLIDDLKESLNTGIDIGKNTTEIKSVINNIKSIETHKSYEQKSLKESIDDFRNRYVARRDNPNASGGIFTGYSFLDYILGPLLPSQMLLVAGSTGMGKSTVLMNMALQMWLSGNTIEMDKDFKEGADVLYFTLEMPFTLCQERSLSRLAMVPQRKIRDALLTDIEAGRIKKVLDFIGKYPFEFEIADIPRGTTIEMVENVFNDITSRKRKPKVVVIDYLTLMEYNETEMEDWLKVGHIAGLLHSFCRDQNILLLSAVQLNEAKMVGKATDDQIGLHRIGRSRQISHHCEVMLQIEKRQNEEQFPDMYLHIIKSRNSETGKGRLFKNFACCALLDSPMDATNTDPGDISNSIDNIFKGKL